MKNLFKLCSVLVAAGFLLASCEGPMGPAGKDGQNGANGADGQDANETCKLCHNPEVVDAVAVQYELAKHSYGIVAEEEAGNTGCSPCHTDEAFKYMVSHNVPATFTKGTNGKYSNDYVTVATDAIGSISCFTCHSSLHTTYEGTDFSPLTTTAPVSMTMWAGAKTINLAQNGGMGNLCVKCHQPRPLTTSTSLTDGRVVNYDSLANYPTRVFYDNVVGNKAPNQVVPSYRTHVHYGTVGAIFAGTGGVEFPGTLAYESSPHTTLASCENCHMVDPIDGVNGKAGGHTFWAKGNFNGCNTANCHPSGLNSSSALWTGTRTDVKALLDALAAKINAIGGATPILHSESDSEANLWAGNTTGNWDGYLNIYDPSTNPGGAWRNPAPGNSWTQAQKDTNTALPIFPSLTNGVMGAMINFQMCLREYSLGIHNTKYTKALLQNSIDII
jgi:predicted small secreted protein